MYDAREEKTSGEPLRRKKQSASSLAQLRRRKRGCNRGPVKALKRNLRWTIIHG